MYNVLLILLHRPFVEDGHLYNEEPTIAIRSFAICSKAAKAITRLLHRYDEIFSARRAPYLISYATYVAATIHVRIAAQRGPGSDAHTALKTCLWIFDENQETNWAVRRAKLVIVNLMKRMRVTLSKKRDREGQESGGSGAILQENQPHHGRDDTQHVRRGLNTGSPSYQAGVSSTRTTETEPIQYPTTPELDIEMIIQSFIHDQGQTQSQLPLFPQVFQPEQSTSSAPLMSSYTQTNAPIISLPQQPTISSAAGGYANTTGPQFGDYTAMQSGLPNPVYNVDDLLFGFNGSAQDEIWMDGFMFGGWGDGAYGGGEAVG